MAGAVSISALFYPREANIKPEEREYHQQVVFAEDKTSQILFEARENPEKR